MSKIAIVDLLFNWPGDGGARLDVKKISEKLSEEHEVCLFIPHFNLGFSRGEVRKRLNFNVRKIPFTYPFFTFNLFQAPLRIKREVDKFKPDIVFVTDGWHMKPYIVNAFLEKQRSYKVFLRFYAYEGICIKSHGHFFKDNRLCNINYLNISLKNLFVCNRCSIKWLLKWPNWNFRQEFFASGAFLPTYPLIVKKILKSVDNIIVYNNFIKKKIEKYNQNIVVDSGVDTSLFTPSFDRKEKEAFKILMVGRVEDPMKGFQFIYEAVKRLRRVRTDFEFLVTTPIKYQEEYIKSLGWLNQTTLADLLREVDVCVFPSLWPEPFGIVVLEAMASAKPVIITGVGGMQRIIEDEKDGFIVKPGAVEKLASVIDNLLDDDELRENIGWSGRKKAVNMYDWEVVYNKYYDELFTEKEKHNRKLFIPELNIDNSNNPLKIFNTSINKYVDLRVQRVYEWLYKNRPQPPTLIGYFASNRCNLNCKFCVRNVSNFSTENEISKERIMELIRESYDMGVFTWCLIGGIGEPMMKKGIIDIMEKIKYPFDGFRSMAGFLLTNGTLFNEERIKKIVEIGWDDICISMDTVEADTLDYLRGGKDVLDKIAAALECFKKWKTKYRKKFPRIFLNVILCSYNYDKLGNIIDFASKMGVARIIILPLFSWDCKDKDVGLKASIDKDMMLNKKQIKKLSYILEKAQNKAHSYNIEINARNFLNTMIKNGRLINPFGNIVTVMKSLRKTEGRFDIHCYEPWHTLNIRMDGYAEVCTMNDEKRENLKDKSLKQVWYGDYFDNIRRDFISKKLLSACKRCCLETVIRSAKIEQQLIFFVMNNIVPDSIKSNQRYKKVFIEKLR